MELAVLEGDTSSSCLCSLGAHLVSARQAQQAVVVEKQTIVEAKLALGGAGKVSAHDDLACHVCAQNSASGGHEQVDVLDHIDESFVLTVLNVSLAPGESAGGLHRNLGCVFFSRLGLDAFGSDVHL